MSWRSSGRRRRISSVPWRARRWVACCRYYLSPEAKATLERLARIRAQREEAARRRKEEEVARAAIEERVKEQARMKNEAAKKKK